MRIRAGTLDVAITADGRQLETTLRKSDRLSDAFASNVERRMKRVGSSMLQAGQAAGLTDREMAGLERRMRAGLAADSATRALDNLKRYAGLTTAEYKRLANQLGVTANIVEKSAFSFEKLAKKATSLAAAYLSVREGVRIAGNAFNEFAGYEGALTDMAKVTSQSLGEIDAAIKALPRDLGDPTALVQGYYQTISAGVTDSAAAMDMLTTAAKASKAAHVGQADTIKALTKTMAGFDGELKNATEASDLLFSIEKLGQTSFAELVPVIGDVAATTHLVGVSSQEMAAGLSLITQTSGSTSEAATKWRAIMLGLYKPTENMEKVIKALGYTSGQAMVQELGFEGTLRKLQGTAELSGFSLGKLFESSEALTGIAGLGAQDWQRYDTMLEQVGQSAGSTDAAFARFKQTAQGVKDTYDATLKQLAIEFGGELAPMMTAGMQDFADSVQKNKDPIITALGGIEMSVEAITAAVMASTREYQVFANSIAAGIAVVKGEMSFGDWAFSNADELAKKLKDAGDRVRKEQRTQQLMAGDNTGTIPELAQMFPGDMAPKAEKAKKAVDGIKVALKDAGKSAENAANAAARYTERSEAYFEQVQAAIAGMTDSLSGGLEGETLKVDKTFSKIFADIRKSVIGAKGDTEGFAKAWVAAWEAWPVLRMAAQLKDFEQEIGKAARYARDMGTYLSDPGQLEASDWLEGYQQYLEDLRAARANTDQEDAAAVDRAQARWDAYQDHVLQAQRERLEEGGKLDDAYWQDAADALEKHLAAVKEGASDETAYKIYEAKKWDDFLKAQLEEQAKYAGSFGETLSAKWSLAFGGYESETTRAKKSWDTMSEGIIESTQGVVDGVSGGMGDILRMAGDTSSSIEDVVANLKSRLLDMLADMVERATKMLLEDLLGRLSGSGGGSGGADNLFGRYFSTGSGGGGGSYSQSLASLQTLGDYVGRSAGASVGDSLATAASSGKTLFVGGGNALAKIFSDGVDMSQLGSSALWTAEAAQGAVPASAMASTYSAAEVASMSGSWSSMLGTVLPVVGALGGLVGLATSLFGETKKEIRKVAEGYNVAYAGGQTRVSGVDFYSDGSVVGTGVSDPEVTRQISEAFKNAAEAIDDAAENLGFSVDKLIDNFTMPAMNITKDQLGDYIDAGTNLLAFQALEQAGLRGAFDALADDGQIYYDQIQEFSAAFSTVAGSLSAYGYEVRDVAQITQDQIDSLRQKTVETAAGTSQAILTMAASMGATSDQLAELAANASDGSQALAVTDQQLENLLAADYAADLLTAVGGPDAFASIMGNLTSNIFDSMEAYVENLSYYTDKASESIAKLGDGAVTIDNFWTSFDAALKGGLTVDEFEAWGKASQWVANLDAINDAIADYNEAMAQYESSLDARLLKAQGRDDEADKITMLADAEKELADARAAGYDAALLAKIEAVQAAELAKQSYEAAKEQRSTIEALIVREMQANNNPWTDAVSAQYQSRWDYQEAASSGLYSAEQLARLKAVQEKEVQVLFDAVAESFEANAAAAKSRLLRALGHTDEADLYDKQTEVAGELQDALESNLYTAEAYADLVAATSAEVQTLIAQQARDAADYQTDIQARLLTAQGRSKEAALLTQASAAEDALLEARQKGIEGTQTYADLEQALSLERANLIEEQAADERGAVTALNARLARSRGLVYEASVIEALADAESELSDARDAGYSAATQALTRMVQAVEAARDALDHLNEIKADWADLDARLYEAAGDDVNAGWARLVEQQRQELYEAHRNGDSDEYIAKLKQVQEAERSAKWAELIKAAIEEQTATLEDRLGDLTDQFSDSLASFLDVLDEELQRNKSMASDAASTRQSLESTIKSLLYGEDSPLSAAEQVRSLGAQIEAAYQTMTTAGHGQARIDAAGTLQDLAADYLSALQATSGSSGDYLSGYLDVAGKLREAESITAQEENYFQRIADAEEAQQEIFNLILAELRKDDPNTEKLQALLTSSGIMSGAITGIYNDQTSGEGATWRDQVAALLRDAGYADTDITAALGGPTSTGSFLAMLNDFNQRSMPGMINEILSLLNDIKNVAGNLSGPAPEVDPDDYPQYTDAEVNWASHLRDAMNAQSYGGSSSWTVDDILPNLGDYVPWGAAYGITDSTGYVEPSTGDKQYYYAKTKSLNESLYEGAEWSWLETQADIADAYGSGNYAAHWLDAGYAEGISFPKNDAVLYKTVNYLLQKWRHDGGASGDYSSPLSQAYAIEAEFGLGKSNKASALEAAARAHWDAGYGLQEGLMQPYRLGGDAPANSWGLVGEEGPELVRFNAGASLTSHSSSRALLGDAFERVFERLIQQVEQLQRQNEALRNALTAIATYTLDSSDMLRKWDVIGLAARTAATGGQ
ncbi:MAG: phage tail tape measure protein [Elusimicrobiales bacterium]